MKDQPVSFQFRVEDDVGSLVAEHDDYLEWAWYEHGYLKVLRDTSDRRSVVIGRTGVGKSALLIRLRGTGSRVRAVDPLAISLETLTNRSILPKLAAAGVNLDPFFKFFWRYVFVVEVLRAWQEAKKDFSLKTLTFELVEKVKLTGKARRRAAILDDIRDWSGPEFWERSDTVAQKLIERVDANVQAGLKAADIATLSAGGSSETTLNTDFAPKAQTILNELCVQRVKESYDLLREDILTDAQKPLYIVIDHLDSAWVDAPFYYSLINALIEVVGEFAELDNVKVVVALREDIIAVLHDDSQRHRQREKQETMFLRLQWSRKQLVGMINERLQTLLKGRFGEDVSLEKILPKARPQMTQTTLEYVLDRSLERPRDLIDFVNRCLRLAAQEGKGRITWDILNQAELEYSHARLKALEDEWRINYPGLRVVFQAFKGLRNGFTIATLESDRLTEILHAGETVASRVPNDREQSEIPYASYELLERGAEYEDVWKMLVGVLYRVGFIGVKFAPGEPTQYSFQMPLGVERPIERDMALCVHPAFSRVLGISLFGPRGTETALDEVHASGSAKSSVIRG